MPKLAVLGQPVAHSRSPAMHSAALAELGLAPEWTYEAIEAGPEDFERRVRAMAAEGFAGANVTVPHKLSALALADHASDAAREIGAANTLSFDEGRIEAENTDAPGLLEALPDPPAGKRALVLGAGGSARACVWALSNAGAEVSIWNRTGSRSDQLATDLGVGVARLRAGAQHLEMNDWELIVHATTVGMTARSGEAGVDLEALPLDLDGLGERHLVVDLVYGSSETELLRAARERGAAVVDGIEVLVRQGAESLRIWTGEEAPVETMRHAARSA
jgi:shikimate dehydrogenase